MTEEANSKGIPEFSLVKGGLVYRIFRKLRLHDDELEPVWPRVIVLAAITWLPLLVLSLFERHAVGGAVIPFLHDIETHVRFLIVLPLLLFAETSAQTLIGPRIEQFTLRNIVREKDLPKFKAAVASAHRLRDSVTDEILLIAVVLVAGRWIYSGVAAVPTTTPPHLWFANPADGHWNLTLAGYWLACVSLPLFQLFLLRWYFRLIVWFAFLRHVAKLDLNLIATHSDRAAGLGFLTKCAYAFSYLLLAHGALLSGYIAGRAIHFGQDVREFKLEAAALVVLLVFVILLPLVVFAPKLVAAKWRASDTYGNLASRYVGGFEKKWIDGTNPEGERLLGSGDIQSLADLSNSYAVVEQMKLVPFGVHDALYLAAMVVVPLLPLVLFILSVEEILDKLIQILM